ncbi:Uncharacterised protein [Serratia liquefaciens]|uniref:hypothetical protein n=1 Tax=Serratia liquefaciens TaxID=614 RepID=UPI0021793177|nr:hypothetical protein [Serratia liquefaciens]CAI2025305.1 Uncharacterised protein [Serratia liquefaciens]
MTKYNSNPSTLELIKAQLKASLNSQLEAAATAAKEAKIEKSAAAGKLLAELITKHLEEAEKGEKATTENTVKAGRNIKSRGIALTCAAQGGPANNRQESLLMKAKSSDGRRRVFLNKSANPEEMRVSLIRKSNGSIVASNGYKLAQSTIEYMKRVGMEVTITDAGSEV